MKKGLPHSSVGKESACNAGDPGLISGSGRSPGEGTGYPLQYSWASLVAQTVKKPPTMRENWVPSLGWEDPLEEGMATHSSILALENPHGQRSLVGHSPWSGKELGMTERLSSSSSNNNWFYHFPHPGIEPRSPALQVDSLLTEPPGKLKNTRVGGLSLLQGIFPTQKSNRGLQHCRRSLYQLSYLSTLSYFSRFIATWKLF